METFTVQVLFEFDKRAFKQFIPEPDEVKTEFKNMLERMEKMYYDAILKEVPIDTWNLYFSHETRWEEYGFEIEPTADYAKYVIGGHATMVSEAQRRWWFWYLNNILGGEYERKTEGPPGQVPPNDYIGRAIESSEGEFLNIFEDFMAWLGMDLG